MATNYKVLGQLACASTTEETVYACPAATQAIITSVVICNRTASAVTFRLYLAPDDAVTGDKQYLYYDVSIPGNDTFVATIGICMGSTDDLRFYASAASLSVNAFGCEIGE
jgi:methenyltetrahydromethanopterin cyclohydrolase